MPRKRGSGEVSAAAALMGSKGGKARAAKLTPAQRKEIGKQLADARKRIPADKRKRIAKAAVAKREEYRKQTQT